MKTPRVWWSAVLTLLLVVGYGQSARPASVAPAGDPGSLVVTAPAGLTRDAPGTYRTDLGTLDPLRVATVERTFTVRNTGRHSVTMADLRGSCGCETLLLTRKGAQAKSLILAPGDEADIHLSIRLNTYADGPVRKYVYAYGPASTGQGTPLMTIALDMRLEKSIIFDPPSVDFGTVPAGQPASRPLLVTALKAMVAGDDLPTPASLNPDVTVRPVAATLPVVQDGKPALRRLFLVILSSHAPAGQIGGDIRFESSARPSEQGPLIQTASLLGIVSSSLSAAPSTAFFGSLPWGSGPTRAVVITLPAGSVGALTISADRPWVTATLSPAVPASGRRLLTISLLKDAPAGDLLATVTLVMGGKESLAIPVIAELTK